ncbi:hypothetical protein CSA08_02240 [Candidatus Gracilibacteria bacterium]|nr:MAG: hypothetical protein CSA08_02240 [Candidatus Gracilibacteria bacterium]
MQKFDNFYFKSFNFDKKNLLGYFNYYFDSNDNSGIKEEFEEIVDFKCDFLELNIQSKDDAILDNILFNIHLALGISYYKLFPTRYLFVESGYLDDNQIRFWEKFYLFGLGEFLIKNEINPNGIINFKNTLLSKKEIKKFNIKSKNILLPWGGGKDSIVSSILLDSLDFTPFIFGKLDTIKVNTLKVLGKKPLQIKRSLSKNLFSLNKKGYYNGHIPITGIIAFISQLVCYLYDYRYTVLSNEKSASEANTFWHGISINHQYSKSYEFEKDFNDYVFDYISEDSKYFSILRGFYEYRIAQIFSNKAEKYFSSFSSCNKNFFIKSNLKINGNWCNKCEKCCFVYLLLSSFLGEKELENIFGANLYKGNELLVTFQELLGFSGNKPYECVGTYKECLFSAYKSIKYYKKLNLNLPYILKILEKNVVTQVEKVGEKNIELDLLKNYEKNFIPSELSFVFNLL